MLNSTTTKSLSKKIAPSNSPIYLLKRNFGLSGGLEKYTDRLWDAFQKRGYQTHILTSSSPEDREGITLLPTKAKRGKRFLEEFSNRCADFFRNHESQVILGMDYDPCSTHLRTGNGVHRAFLHHRHKIDSPLQKLSHYFSGRHRTFLNLERKSFTSPNLRTIFANSAMVRDEILRYYDVDPKKIEVIHNGVEWAEWQSLFDAWENKRASLFAQYGLDPSSFQFLFVGHNYQRKGLDIVLQALSTLPFKDFQLLVVGKDKSLPSYRALVKKLGLEKNVHFFGAQKNVTDFYTIADALLIPSLYDPCANVTLEALAMGLFVVSSKTNGASEILSQESGVVIPSLFDRDAVSTSLETALAHPKKSSSALLIRNSIRKYDFNQQLNKMIDRCLEKTSSPIS